MYSALRLQASILHDLELYQSFLSPNVVAWFVVAPLKNQPLAGGFQPAAMVTGLLVNAAWGVGTALLLRFLWKTEALGGGRNRSLR